MELKVAKHLMMRESNSIRKFVTVVINDERSFPSLAAADQGSEPIYFPMHCVPSSCTDSALNNPAKFNLSLSVRGTQTFENKVPIEANKKRGAS